MLGSAPPPPLKDKTGAAVRNALQDIVRVSERKPKKLWVDEGKEFYNRILKTWLENNRIKMYSTHNEGEAVVAERFNRTLKSRMWRYFTLHSTNVYIDALSTLVDDYNESVHRSIGMSPAEASRPEKERFMSNPAGRAPPPPPRSQSTRTRRRFRVGDKVRIAVNKLYTFEKGYTPRPKKGLSLIESYPQILQPIAFAIS